jgi:hypothetical protein
VVAETVETSVVKPVVAGSAKTPARSALGARVCGVLILALGLVPLLATRENPAVIRAAVQTLVALVLIAGPAKERDGLKEYLALVTGAAFAARAILTGLMIATDMPMRFAFVELPQAAQAGAYAAAVLLLLLGHPGVPRVLAGVLCALGGAVIAML